MINATSRGTTILNPTIDYTTKRTPIEDLFHESDKEEDDPFNSMPTYVFDGRTSNFVTQSINEMVLMNNFAYLTPRPPHSVVPYEP